MIDYVIKCGNSFYIEDGYCWTNNINKAKKFSINTAMQIIEYWNKLHHEEKCINGKIIPSTALCGKLPINCTVEKIGVDYDRI